MTQGKCCSSWDPMTSSSATWRRQWIWITWEGDLDEEQTTITELVRGGRQNDRACYHCQEVGHLKAQCPQRHKGPVKPTNKPMVRGRGTGRSGNPSNRVTKRGRSSAPSWSRGTTRGRGRPFSGRPTNNRTGVAQITEMPDYDEYERGTVPRILNRIF